MTIFFRKPRARPTGGYVFWLQTKLNKEEFFKLVRVLFEKQVSKVQKKTKTNV